MPFYEYRCEDCGHQLEVLQKISDAPLKTCPECGADALRKLVSASAFVLKGSGWYVTDFRDKPKPEKAGDKTKADSGKGETAGSKKSEAGADSKTSAKSEDSAKPNKKPPKKAANE